MGDLYGEGYPIPESCSVVALDKNLHKTKSFSTIVTGGIQDANILGSAFGLRFAEDEKDGFKTLMASSEDALTELLTPRHSHQSVVVKVGERFKLFVIGGRGKNEAGQLTYLDSVETLDLTFFLFPYLANAAVANNTHEDAQWEKAASLKSPRASFAALVLNDYIYVYGGIAGIEGTHNPKLANPLIE